MRKTQKQKILGLIDSMHQVHEEIKKALEQNNLILAQDMISGAQESAISLGENIEKTEGEGHVTVSCIEEYCESLFCVFEDINKNNFNINKVYKMLRKQLIKIENSVKNDIVVRQEVVFFPYKASMWDSLESIYLAAKADPDCDAYCIPIPYYTLNPDRSFGEMHYEGGEYPEDIEVTDWQEYNFEERRPDVVYIHNPYDNCNLVTSVHPRFYSFNLKKYTDTLVYVPYYVTAGSMLEVQGALPSYQYVDYIVIQSPEFRKYFDGSIPDKKFLSFGSPKFDRVIKKCQNPPEPPEEWLGKMKGKKVFFYNTSISGMLADTENFLKKMEYVFKCFEKNTNVCLLWRPHPLLESALDSMRTEFKEAFLLLKKGFIDKGIGIYDTTPDVENSIALSSAYIGDEGSSVVALFGIAGKPIFVLNNMIHSAPKEDSWRGEVGFTPTGLESDRFAITQNNKLYCSEAFAYDYKYKCDLSKYAHGTYYGGICEINGKLYVWPRNAGDILVVGSSGVEKRIGLKTVIQKNQYTFSSAWKWDRYLLLIPLTYPAIVRLDTENGELRYLSENIDTFVKKNKQGQTIVGGAWLYNGILYIASPTDNLMFRLDVENCHAEIIILPEQNSFQCGGLLEHDGKLWMFPVKGKKVICWDPNTKESKEYFDFPSNFQCIHPTYGYVCDDNPFGGFGICGDEIYLSPLWANMYIRLNTITGKLSEWKVPFEDGEGREYFFTTAKSGVLFCTSNDSGDTVKVFSQPKRKLYEINTKTNSYIEIEVKFDIDELRKNEPGFCTDSERLKYCCRENAFNSLECFLDGKITGNQFDVNRQREEYRQVAVNFDGNCGKKLHDFISKL